MEQIVGIIGGTGLYSLEGLKDSQTYDIDTPFGKPSSLIHSGILDGVRLLFIARHGVGHTLLPSEVPYQANIYALKELGAKWCISVSAVGSLQEEAAPGEVVVPNQFIDRTKVRPSTFFGDGIVAHVAFATPFCPVLRKVLLEVARARATAHQTKAHDGGTYVCMEGPAFSTRAESRMYRELGGTIIGMTNLPEAKLAREAEIAYATLAMVTDYDCWRSDTDDVDVTKIIATLHKNSALAKEIIQATVPKLKQLEPSKLASEALKTAIITAPENISERVLEKLKPIIGDRV